LEDIPKLKARSDYEEQRRGKNNAKKHQTEELQKEHVGVEKSNRNEQLKPNSKQDF